MSRKPTSVVRATSVPAHLLGYGSKVVARPPVLMRRGCSGSLEGVRVRSHNPSFSANDLILNPDFMPQAKVGDVLRIWSPADETCMVLLLVSDLSRVKGNVQISVGQHIADLVALPEVVNSQLVAAADRSRYRVELLALSIKGLYAGRGEMYALTGSLRWKPLYLRQNIAQAGLRVTVSALLGGLEPGRTGIVDPLTKVVFRSKSARFFLFVQVSRSVRFAGFPRNVH
jgi:hypothetical protein